MDYSRRPIGEVLRGPLLHTPQGVACLVFSALSIVGALAYLAFPQIANWPPFRFKEVLFAWPLIVFITFVRFSYNDDFAPSLNATLMVVLTGAFPFFGAYIYDAVA
jgi:hypothetical protein